MRLPPPGIGSGNVPQRSQGLLFQIGQIMRLFPLQTRIRYSTTGIQLENKKDEESEITVTNSLNYDSDHSNY